METFRNLTCRRRNVLSLDNQSKMVQAILKSDIQKVKLLITGGEGVNETDLEKRSYLHLAAAIGASEISKILIAAGARVDAKDRQNLTPFHRACRQNHDEVAAILINQECDVNAKDRNWVSPLHICAANNSLECAKLFISKVTNIDATDKTGSTALHHAAFNGHCDMLTFLCKQGSKSSSFDSEDRRPLHWAAAVDNTDAIRLLISYGAKVTCRDMDMRTPLHYAAANSCLYAIQLLIESGAKVTAVDKFGNTPLHLACYNGQDDVIDELVTTTNSSNSPSSDHSVINAINESGLTPLHFSAASPSGTAALEVLASYYHLSDLGHGGHEQFNNNSISTERPLIQIDARDKFGRTPLHLACKYGRLIRVQELLRVGADANASDKAMLTPLHYSVRGGHVSVIEVLLAQKSVDPNVMDSAGMTVLHHAAFFGLTDAVSKLLRSDKKANPLIHDITGRFPHFLAAMSGNVQCLELLMPLVPNIDLSTYLDNFDRSPLHYAAAGQSAFPCLEHLVRLMNESNSSKSTVMLNVNQKDIFGRSPLHYAAGADTDGKSVDLLLTSGSSIDLADNEGYYSLNYSAAAGKVTALEKLLSYSAFAWHRVKFKLCPTLSAAANGHSECLELLLSAGLYEDLGQAMAYASRSGHEDAYQVIHYYVSTNDSSVYFTADEATLDSSGLLNLSSDVDMDIGESITKLDIGKEAIVKFESAIPNGHPSLKAEAVVDA